MSGEPLLACEGALADEPEGAICRVCHAGATDAKDPLLSPCLCDGSVRWVHRSCLDEWRIHFTRRAYRCELCRFVYIYETERPSRCRLLVRLLRRGVWVLLPIAPLAALAGLAASPFAALLVTGTALCLRALAFASVGTVAAIPLRIPRVSSASGDAAAEPASRGTARAVLAAARRQLTSGGSQPFIVEGLPEETLAQVMALAEVHSATRAVVRARAEEAMEDPGADLPAFACCLILCLGAPVLALLLARFLLPPAVSGAAQLIRQGMDDAASRGGLEALAALGYAHSLASAAVLVAGCLRRPVPEAVRGPSGIPLVRSLAPDERTHLRAALRASRASTTAEV